MQNLTRFDRLVNPDGTPTDFFMRLLQNSNILSGDTQTAVEENTADIAVNTADIATIEAFSINTTGPITGGPVPIGSAASVTIAHDVSGVTAATYGDAANIPQLTVDARGHVTAAAEVPVVFGIAAQDEGGALGSFTTLNFTGAGVVASDAGGGVAEIAVAGGGGGGVSPVLNEVPAGAINGANVTFTLAAVPTAAGISLFQNGLLLLLTTDYTIAGLTITMVAAPLTGDTLRADYFT